jgi:hypothetical protein
MHINFDHMSTFQVTLTLLGLVVLQCVCLFIFYFIFFSSIGQLDREHPFSLGEGGRRAIAFGLPFIGLAMLIIKGNALDHFFTQKFGPKVFPYVFFGAMFAVFGIAIILDKYIPKRLSIPFGIVGYAIGFSLLCWYEVLTDRVEDFNDLYNYATD